MPPHTSSTSPKDHGSVDEEIARLAQALRGGSSPEEQDETTSRDPHGLEALVCAGCPVCRAAAFLEHGGSEVLRPELLGELTAALTSAATLLREAGAALLAATERAHPSEHATTERASTHQASTEQATTSPTSTEQEQA